MWHMHALKYHLAVKLVGKWIELEKGIVGEVIKAVYTFSFKHKFQIFFPLIFSPLSVEAMEVERGHRKGGGCRLYVK